MTRDRSFRISNGRGHSALAAADLMLVKRKYESVVGADALSEMRRHLREFENLSETQHRSIALRCIRCRDPLRVPHPITSLRRELSRGAHRFHEDQGE